MNVVLEEQQHETLIALLFSNLLKTQKLRLKTWKLGGALTLLCLP